MTSSPSATCAAATRSCRCCSCSPPLLSGQAVLPQALATDIYLTGGGLLLIVVSIAGLLFRPGRRVLGMGVDSLTVLVLYWLSLGGLVAIAATQPAN